MKATIDKEYMLKWAIAVIEAIDKKRKERIEKDIDVVFKQHHAESTTWFARNILRVKYKPLTREEAIKCAKAWKTFGFSEYYYAENYADEIRDKAIELKHLCLNTATGIIYIDGETHCQFNSFAKYDNGGNE